MNLGNILTSSNEKIIYTDGDYLFEDKSYELECISAIIEDTKAMYDDTSNLLINISEHMPINESVSDVLDSIKSFISKIIRFLSDIIKKFWKRLHAFLDDDEYIKSNADTLRNIGSFKFVAKGFKFSFYESNIAEVFNDIAQQVIRVAEKCSMGNDSVEIMRAIEVFYNSNIISNTEEYYNYIRGHVIRKSTPITANEFSREVKKSFRSGEIDPIPIVVDKRYVQDNIISTIVSRKYYEQLETATTIEKRRCENSLDQISRALDTICKRADRLNLRINSNSSAIVSIQAFYMKLRNILSSLYQIMQIYIGIRFDTIRDMATQNKAIAKMAVLKIRDHQRRL